MPLSVLGIVRDTYLTRFITGEKRKKAFDWFVLVIGLCMIRHELFFPTADARDISH